MQGVRRTLINPPTHLDGSPVTPARDTAEGEIEVLIATKDAIDLVGILTGKAEHISVEDRRALAERIELVLRLGLYRKAHQEG